MGATRREMWASLRLGARTQLAFDRMGTTMKDREAGTTCRREILVAASGAATLLPAVALAQAPTAATPPQVAAASPPASSAIAARAVESVREPILRISREVWTNAERSLAEEKSAAIHVRELQAAGFRVTTGTANIPTAFLADWSQGSGGPVIAFLPEYDALPGLGNAAEPRQTPGPTGVEVGHGCGHNLIGAGCTGAAFALKRMMEQDRTPGTIRVFGCAAEEGGAVKVYFVREGLFDGVDAAISWHPAPVAATGAISTAANNGIRIRFHGRTAHAGVEPWAGRSALKAAELFAHGINLMREHIQPTARLHYIYENGGTAVNVVPDFAEVLLTIRDRNRESVVAMTEWAGQIAEGAAMATQTRAEFQVFSGVHQLLPNDALIAAAAIARTAVPQPMSATFLPRNPTRSRRSSARRQPLVVPWWPVPKAIAASISRATLSPGTLPASWLP